MASQSLLPGADSITDSAEVRIQLSTRHPDISLPQNPGPILVNTNFRRYALSTLVNTLLQPEKPIPFDFLINGIFLRTSLDEYLTTNGISAETTLAIEYVRAIIPPLYLASFEHDAWVSCVDVLSETSPAGIWASNKVTPSHERIVSGSYDGLLRVWDMSSNIIATSPALGREGDVSPIKSAKFISPTQIASSTLDRVIKFWDYSEDAEGFSASLSPKLALYGHREGINSIAVHQPSSRILSASGDKLVGFWSTRKSDGPAPYEPITPSVTSKNIQSSKRQKIGPAATIPCRGPLSLLKSHTEHVSDTIFAPNDHTVGYSVSWDHTLKTWDLPTSTCVDTRSTSAALFSLTALPSLNLIAVGSSNRNITLIDPRASATTVSAMILRDHINTVSSLSPNPESTYGLLSGSYDGTCRVWDVRAGKSENEGRVGRSMYCIERESTKGQTLKREGGEGVKVFDVCWDKDVGIVSASEDKRVQVNRGNNIVGTNPF